MHLLKADDVLKNAVGQGETMRVKDKCHYRRDEPPFSGARKGNKSNEKRGRKNKILCTYKAGRPVPLSQFCRDVRCRKQGKWAETGKGPTLDLCCVPAVRHPTIACAAFSFFLFLPFFPFRWRSHLRTPVPLSQNGRNHPRIAPPNLHLHSLHREQGEATSGCHPSPTSLVLSAFLFFPFSSPNRTDGVVDWQATGQEGRTGGDSTTWPSWIFPHLSP